ncbi:MAG: transcriptional repressor LexA [Alphaproteobacteria bacterium]|nr:transcriptional repressor LexA [Alphaproteobacteria bacterium]MCB1550551.1 transcriptional repressor LexA [Alphaproteobacteria bacterium]MCB9984588.1 transcriptional repressor LexA [Micavibrio sp.]HPQ51301.1 transcriptional repressor LexA [Alphaproteobacteria bacterium]HRK97931.1 transcriptional repressor LexA [Alphaproteobacteria bacterium]
MLTRKQRELLLFIHGRLQVGGVAPSFDEMKDALDLKSKSGIHRLITGLVERGYLQRLPNRARAVEVTRLPEDIDLKSSSSKPSSSSVLDKISEKISDVTSLPMVGKIAAGTPIEAIQNDTDFLDVPASMLGSGEYYALRVEGDSMVNAGINDDDIVIIRKSNQARDGKIVVALVDGTEATLKRIYRREGKVILEAENEAYKPRILTADRVEIQGELASLMRTYH